MKTKNKLPLLLITDGYKISHNKPYDEETMKKINETKLVVILVVNQE